MVKSIYDGCSSDIAKYCDDVDLVGRDLVSCLVDHQSEITSPACTKQVRNSQCI